MYHSSTTNIQKFRIIVIYDFTVLGIVAATKVFAAARLLLIDKHCFHEKFGVFPGLFCYFFVKLKSLIFMISPFWVWWQQQKDWMPLAD